MKKILFCIPSLCGRGAEKVLVNLVNNLDKEKYDISILALFDIDTNKKYLNEYINYKAIFKKAIRGNVYWLKVFKPETLFKMMIKDDYDIIVSFLQSPVTRIVSGCEDKNVKLINWIHTEVKNINDFSRVYRNREEFEKCFKKFNMTVFVSKIAKKAFEEKSKIEIPSCVKYNIVEDDVIKEKAEEITDIVFDSRKINLISVGGLSKEKGYDRLLRVYKKLLEKNLNLHLYILGSGKEKQNLNNYIEKNNLQKYVDLLGYKENPYKYVKQSDLFVCSSYREGYSTAVTEALILGIPVITTECSGMEELLDNGKYGLITDNSEEGLYNGLLSILTNKALLDKYKRLAIERSSYFNMEKNLKEIEELFD